MKTTIFYENSQGVINQFTGEIIGKSKNTIQIKVSPKKIYDLNLILNSEFAIICEVKIPKLDILKSCQKTFDENKRFEILQELEKNKNILHYWNGTQFLN